ncbi:MAG: DUF1552 domain-containing protein, partial [Planctomycetia bacterium]
MPALSRRTLLKGSGAALALPLLDAMRPAFGRAGESVPRRLVAICTNLGVYEKNFLPATAGRDFALTPYLEPFADLRDQFTVVSGTSHPDVTGGHAAEATFLTAAPHPGSASFKNSISLDQFAADRIGFHTRVHSLPLAVSKRGNQSISFTSSGVMVTAESSPAKVYRQLFVAGDAASIERQLHDLRTGRSILDSVADRAESLRKALGPGDRDRMDQYFTSVREVERRMLVAEEWEHKPKPKPEGTEPKDQEYLLEKLAAMYELTHLALATDSTRLVTLMIKLDGFSEHIPGVSLEAHNLSHHVNRPEAIEQLTNLELAEFKELAKLLGRLAAAKEDGQTLLDRTVVFYGSNLGNAKNHHNHNLPNLLAGGGLRQGRHLAFDKTKNAPLPN